MAADAPCTDRKICETSARGDSRTLRDVGHGGPSNPIWPYVWSGKPMDVAGIGFAHNDSFVLSLEGALDLD